MRDSRPAGAAPRCTRPPGPRAPPTPPPGPLVLLRTDIVMPARTGRKLADTIRATRPGLRVLYMSGYPDGAIASQGILESGVAYLAKPFTTDGIIGKVREVLEGP